MQMLPQVFLVICLPSLITAMWKVDPATSKTILSFDSGIFPGSHKAIVVENVGRAGITAKAVYGTAFGWIGDIDRSYLSPGYKKTFVLTRPYYCTALTVINDNPHDAAIFSASRAQYGDSGVTDVTSHYQSNIDIDVNAILKYMVVFGLKKIPEVGSVLSGLVSLLWPDKKQSTWDQVKDNVRKMVDEESANIVDAILRADIAHYKQRINSLIDELDDSSYVSHHYMNIAEDMNGLEYKFILDQHPSHKKLSYFILPLYSTVVSMKLNFYVLGIKQAKKLNLSEDNVKDITRYAKTMLYGNAHSTGAIDYINGMYKERLDDAYNTADPDYVYNTMMAVRTHISHNGFAFIPVWKQLIDNPFSDATPYIDALLYPPFGIRTTVTLNKQAIPEELSQPLSPRLINGRRNQIDHIDVVYWRIRVQGGSSFGDKKIGGIKISFKNGDRYELGLGTSTFPQEGDRIEFKGARLNKLKVGGLGAIDNLTFYFSDGREVYVGFTERHGRYQEFVLENHHIAGMYLANDSPSLGGQAAGIAVSFLRNPEAIEA